MPAGTTWRAVPRTALAALVCAMMAHAAGGAAAGTTLDERRAPAGARTFVRQDVVEHDRIVVPSPIVRGRCGPTCPGGAATVRKRRVKERYWFRAPHTGYTGRRPSAGTGCTARPCPR
jgi:hypothetical protein